MLIGHRYEHTTDGDLRIRSYNWAQTGLALFIGPCALIIPLLFVGDAIARQHWPFPSLGPLPLLVIVLGFLLLMTLGLGLLLYTEIRETLLLSTRNGIARHSTTDMLGLREELRGEFALQAPKELVLRRRRYRTSSDTTLWLVMDDDSEHPLSPVNVPVVPGSRQTDRWVDALAGYLHVPVRTVQLDPEPPVAVLPPATTALPPRKRFISRKRRKKAARQARLGAPINDAGTRPPPRKVPADIRVFFALLGAFLAALELNHLISLVNALTTGSIRVAGYHSGASTYYWSEQPYSFAFLVVFGIVMVPLVGAFAYQCLRMAVTGHRKPTV